MSKSLFLHTKKLSAAKIKAIESVGFVCVQVESFDEIKIVSSEDLNKPERILLDAALKSLSHKDVPHLSARDVVAYFNHYVCERIQEMKKAGATFK